MKTTFARVIARLSVVLAMTLTALAADNTPPVVAVDGAGVGETFEATGSLVTARNNHTATLLADGKVLVTGGFGDSEPLDTAELYDPDSGEWTETGSLGTARYSHTATLLADGKVLVTGGHGISDPLDSAELYDPATGQWMDTGSLENSRYYHTATLLADGKVLVAAGYDYLAGDSLDSAELYDPATGEWTETDSLDDARYVHTATLLANGQVLVAGGLGETDFLGSAEIYDPSTGEWVDTGGLEDARYIHTATLLANGKVLVAGGYGEDFYLSSAELYDPGTGEWTETGGLEDARYNHKATLLGNGKVLVTGGFANSGSLGSAELHDPAAGEWTGTGSLDEARYNHTATLLADGNVLVTGGYGDSGPLTSAELYLLADEIPTTSEGEPITITGTFSDEQGNATVTLTASIGVITPDNDGGTWSWTMTPADGPAITAVTITATDDQSAAATAEFTFTVTNLPPETSISAPDTADEDTPVDFSFTATDRGGVDQAAGFAFSINYGDGGSVILAPVTTSPLEIVHTFASPGVYDVTVTATDKDGATSEVATQTITIADVTAPVIDPHADAGPVETTGSGGATVIYAAATATDNSGEPVTDITYSQDSGTLFAPGITTVTITATDAAGNSSTATFKVTVTVPGSGLVNGSFEDGYDGWTFSGHQSIQSAAPYIATDGIRLVSFNDGNRAPGGVLSQTFPTLPGESYQLTFDMGVLAFNSSQQKLGVELSGASSIVSQAFTISPLGSRFRWESKSLRFMADSSTTTLVFRDLSTATVSVDLTLDHVVLTPLVTRTLNVASLPSAGAEITVSPPDNDAMANGISNFIRRYLDGVTVNLTAAYANNGFRFQKWLRNGADLSTDRVISIVMDGNLTLTAVYVDSPPVITTQPVGGAVALGGTTTLRVTAEGTGTLFYQWRLGGFDIPGADSPEWVISDMQPGDVGTYDVVVSNAIGPVTSEPATVSLVTATLVNGSFEAGYTGWTSSGHQSIEDAAPYVATDGIRLVAFNGGNATPNGTLAQAFATTPGRSYTLNFDAGALFFGPGTQALGVTVTGTGNLLTRTVTLTGSGGGSRLWQPQGFTFIANSPTSTLAFADLSPATGNIDLFLDHVSVTEGTDVPNTAPVAGNDHYATTLNTALMIPAPGVIANDSDADSSPLTVTLVTGPAHGVANLNSNGSFAYTPETGHTGPDSFTYQANDGGLDSNIATVSLEVNPPSTQLLFNGGFESGFTGWITTGNQFIQSAAPYAATEGTKLASFNAGNNTPNAVLSQTFATVAGQSYTLAFDLGVLSYNTNPQTMRVTVTGAGGLLSQVITITGSGGGKNRWLPQSFSFVADGAISTLTFRDQSTSTNGLDMVLDHVRVTGVSALAALPPDLMSGILPIPETVAQSATPPPVGEMGTPSLAGTPGDFTISLTATAAGIYVFERSVDLVRWDHLGEKKVDEPGFVEFHDRTPSFAPQQSESGSFYRIGRRAIGP
ncbi:MAG: kelch repeat-containing protein [Verrucomicrobiota bacterium]